MIIYIHGIGEHPPEEQWKREWDIALFGKPMGDFTASAYWSDILHGQATAATMRAQARRDRASDPAGGEIDVDEIVKDAAVPPAKRQEAAARLEGIAEALAHVAVV